MSLTEPARLPPVWILTFGSLGDVLPLAALGGELARRGHAVTLWCGSLHARMVEEMGVCAVPFETDALPPLRLHAGTLFKTPLMWRRVEQAMRMAFADMALRLEALPPGLPRPIVVASTFALAGRLAQEKFGLRLATVHLSPMCMASFLDMPAIRGLTMPDWVPLSVRPALGRTLERLVMDPVTARSVNAMRREIGLTPVSHVFSRWVHSPDLVLGLFPDWFGVPQPDWPPNARILDFPMADGDGNHALAQEDPGLEHFLASGSDPVVFYPGSAKRDTRAFFDEALGTCERLGVRAILLTRYRENVVGGRPAAVGAVPALCAAEQAVALCRGAGALRWRGHLGPGGGCRLPAVGAA